MTMKSDSPAFLRFADVLRERKMLQEQRDDLLGALDTITDALRDAQDIARAAIARAKGEKS